MDNYGSMEILHLTIVSLFACFDKRMDWKQKTAE